MRVLEFQVPPIPQIAAIGHGVWRRGMTHAQRIFEAYDLIVCAEGALYLEEDGERYEVEAGSMLVLEPGLTHGGYRPTDTETEVYWIHFCHARDRRRPQENGGGPGRPLERRTDQDTEPYPGAVSIPKFGPVDLHAIRPLLKQMLKLRDNLTIQRSYELHLNFGLLLLELQKSKEASSPRSRAERLGEQAAAYLAERLEHPFDSAEMERDLHYHFDYLSRCLKQYTGLSPLAYRHRLQTERAKRLLAHSDEPLARIGERCGFPDPNYFARLFKRESGLTPGEYRRRYGVFQKE
ncbi:AraC family transcriptional regulator [Saccharibacillus sp. CPCC 101409]|uniref:AraC family transcriptional regulator n=1 Tax=Saccharibacillus sp. CPCC 101409 TaxID=3058041 RepID=UPI002672CB57|nr:AraC family transcriptional regulator [Saccharibacillus sp. CPCC 101409]MDO3411860.1 AraC family transcriptional regulator [Saccharibacillus sp. CPCC 101409]